MTENKENPSEKDSLIPLAEPLEKLRNASSPESIEQLAHKTAKAIRERRLLNKILSAATFFFFSVAVGAFRYTGNTLGLVVSICSIVAAGVCFAVFVWRVLKAGEQEVPEEKNDEDKKPVALPSLAILAVIKGGTAFGVSDGEIFKGLKRSHELDQLLAFANKEESPALVLRGKSGSGKTSLLRAGLEYSLNQDNIPCVYLEAKPDNTHLELIKSIESALKTELKRRLVVIIDQFEHLHKESLEHKPFFDFVRKVCSMPAPHTAQLVIAFNDEYRDKWVEFETATGLQVPRVILKPFNADEAKKIIGTILHDAKLTVDDRAIRQYVQDVADNEGVSPVAIRIGLFIMANWAERREITAAAFAYAGGTEGLFTEYVRHWIENYIQEDHQKVFLESLRKTLAVGENNILSVVATAENITKDSRLDNEHVTHYLDGLASSEARILEKVVDQELKCYYRLANPQFIPALTGLLIEMQQEAD